MRIRLAFLALVCSVVVAVPAAFAGPPGKWTLISPNDLENINQPALARTSDGVLHVIFVLHGAHAISHVAVSPGGVAQGATTVTSGWATINTMPDLVTQPDGTLRAFFGGIHSTDVNDPNDNFNTATAPASGNPWSVFPGTVVTGDSAYASDAGVALLADGTPLISFGSTGAGTFVHRGLDPSAPNVKITSPSGGCCTYWPDVAVDSSGRAYVAFYSNATGDEGLWVQQFDPATGQRVGGPVRVPGSWTVFGGRQESVASLARTQIVARPGGGVWVAGTSGYPTANRPFVWQVGAAKQISLGRTRGGDAITAVAADPAGHLWAFWVDRSSATPTLVARRSSAKNPAVFGPAVRFGPPSRIDSAYRLEGNAQAGRLDVVVEFGGTNGIGQWHTQVLPGLALSRSPARIRAGRSTDVAFTVRDPDPVKGARVTAAGKSAITNARGRATISLGPTRKKRITAVATKAGYVKGVAVVKVRR